MQQDCEEFITKLLDTLEETFKGTVIDGVVPALYAGTIKGFVRCCNGHESGTDVREVMAEAVSCHMRCCLS